MVDILIEYDILTLMKKNDKQLELFPNLIKMIEFDRNNMLFSYIMMVVRANRVAKAEESRNVLKTTLTSAV